VLSPQRDDASLGADLDRNNAFSYEDDIKGFKFPFSAHIRRVNPRDALKNEIDAVNLHHFCVAVRTMGRPCRKGPWKMTVRSGAGFSF
jgi:hypothetical protein